MGLYIICSLFRFERRFQIEKMAIILKKQLFWMLYRVQKKLFFTFLFILNQVIKFITHVQHYIDTNLISLTSPFKFSKLNILYCHYVTSKLRYKKNAKYLLLKNVFLMIFHVSKCNTIVGIIISTYISFIFLFWCTVTGNMFALIVNFPNCFRMWGSWILYIIICS